MATPPTVESWLARKARTLMLAESMIASFLFAFSLFQADIVFQWVRQRVSPIFPLWASLAVYCLAMTAFRSIVILYQVNDQGQDEAKLTDERYKRLKDLFVTAYNLFMLVLVGASVILFASGISLIRTSDVLDTRPLISFGESDGATVRHLVHTALYATFFVYAALVAFIPHSLSWLIQKLVLKPLRWVSSKIADP